MNDSLKFRNILVNMDYNKREFKNLLNSNYKKIKLDNNNNNNKNNNNNNNDTITIPNYIYNNIIESIVNYLLLNKKNNNIKNGNNNNKYYEIKNYYYYINEIIKLSLVSKEWYEIISNLITNNIIDNNRIEYWFNEPLLSSTISLPQPDTISYNFRKKYSESSEIKLNFKMNINKEYSIIKTNNNTNNSNNDNNIIKDYFKQQILCLNKLTYEELEEISKLEMNKSLKFRKILVNMDYNKTEFKNLLNSNYKKINNSFDLSKPPSSNNINNNINNNNINKVDITLHNFSLLNDNIDISSSSNDNDNKIESKLYINNISYFGTNNCDKIFNILNHIKSKNIKYINNDDDDIIHMDFSRLFNEDINGQVESIKIYSDFVEPYHLLNVNQLNNLHTLSIPIQFHEIIEIILGNDESQCRNDEFLSQFRNDIINHWELMIESLSTCKSLKNLTISKACPYTRCIYNHFSDDDDDDEFNYCDSSYNDDYDNDDDDNEEEEDDEGDDTKKILNYLKMFSNGIKSLLSSSSSLEYFKIKNGGMVICNDTFSELSNNKSIKTLVLDDNFKTFDDGDRGGSGSCNDHSKFKDQEFFKKFYFNTIQYLFENIFNSSSSNIRHFKFSSKYSNSLQPIFKSILNNLNTIQLYSITIKIPQDILESTLDEIINLSNKFNENQNQNQQPQFKNLNEFKIYVIKKSKIDKTKQYQSLLNDKINNYCHFSISVKHYFDR
ncbi:hypothetical protein ACTFIW_007454 [Dictyostelium discoideum]